MLSELNDIRKVTEDDFQVMETSVGQNLVPTEVVNNKENLKLSAEFDTLYYNVRYLLAWILHQLS